MNTRRKTTLFVVLFLLCGTFVYFSLLPSIVPKANLWAEEAVQIDKLHKLGYDGSGVIIGVIDTGVDSKHQEFDDSSFIAWIDVIHHQNNSYDDEDHGTHVNGLLIAQGSYEGLWSGIYLQGIAPQARIINVKAIPSHQFLYGGGNADTIATGIYYCIDHQADIILLSLGSNPEKVDFSEKIKITQAIDTAVDHGIFIVVPAGNDGETDDGDVCFPANHEDVIAVGSISKDFFISSFSSKGHQYPRSWDPNKKPELVAPGEHILSTRTHGAYGELSGTAQAAAYTAGIIALLLDAYPTYKPSQPTTNKTTIHFFKQVLAESAKKIGSLDGKNGILIHDDWYGYGLIQAYDAYVKLGQ